MKNQKTNIHFGLVGICLLAFSFLQTGCTSLQQSTASIAKDDLYDSPSTPSSKVYERTSVATANETSVDNEEQYQEYQNYQDDRYLRLKVANRNRWNAIDDFGYWNDPRYNFAYYPSYMGWNSWYSGYYGASWYNPFGYSIGLGWGGYYPYMNSFYNMGWGFNDFGFGYGGIGYGMGFGGFGYGWNPYYAGYWNPYGPIYYGGYFGGGLPYNGIRLRDRIPVQPGRTNLAGYNNNNRNFNSNGFRPSGINNSSRNINSATMNNNNFGNLVRRAVNSNANYQSNNNNNTLERPARFSGQNQFNTNSNRVSNSVSSPSFNTGGGGGHTGGGGGNFVGGGRRGGGR
jgi:hypothetical protein